MPGRRLILIHTAFLLVLIGSAGLTTRAFFARQLNAESLQAFDLGFAAFFLMFTGSLLGFGLMLNRRLVLPIYRLRAKVQGVLNASTPNEDLGDESSGEWSELESSIDAIRKDLKTKVESI